MANTVKVKRSGTAAATPSALEHGELAINYADDTLFWKDASNVIQSFVFQAYASATHKSTHATGGSDALSPSDIGAAPAASPTFSGDVTIPDKIVHAGDNSAIRFPADDTVTIETAGAERFRIDSSGNAGFNGATTSHGNLTIKTTSAGSVASPVYNGIAWGYGPNQSIDLGGIDYVSRFTDAGGGSLRFRLYRNGSVFQVLLLDNTDQRATFSIPVAIPAGSGSAGSYVAGLAIIADPDTGIQQVAGANTISLVTGGSERLRAKANGAVHFVPLAADPAGSIAGDVYYNSANNKLRVYNGTSWVDLH